MENKLKAISNNVNNNDTVIDLIDNNDKKRTEIYKSLKQQHICVKNVPVLFATVCGLHLRKFNKTSPNNYNISFCDLERWVG